MSPKQPQQPENKMTKSAQLIDSPAAPKDTCRDPVTPKQVEKWREISTFVIGHWVNKCTRLAGTCVFRLTTNTHARALYSLC